MGQAKRRGDFERRKADAIAAGRIKGTKRVLNGWAQPIQKLEVASPKLNKSAQAFVVIAASALSKR